MAKFVFDLPVSVLTIGTCAGGALQLGRYRLDGVLIGAHEGRVYAVAADGVHIAVHAIVETPEEWSRDFLVPAHAWEAFAARVERHASVGREAEDNLATAALEVECSHSTGLLADQHAAWVGKNRERLEAAIPRLSIAIELEAGGDADGRIRLNASDGFTVECLSLDVGEYPDWKGVLPERRKARVTALGREALLSCLSVCSPQEDAPDVVLLSTDKLGVTLEFVSANDDHATATAFALVRLLGCDISVDGGGAEVQAERDVQLPPVPVRGEEVTP